MDEKQDLILRFNVIVNQENIADIKTIVEGEAIELIEGEIKIGHMVSLQFVFEGELSDETKAMVRLFNLNFTNSFQINVAKENEIVLNINVIASKDNMDDLIATGFKDEEIELGEEIEINLSLEGELSKHINIVAKIFNEYGKCPQVTIGKDFDIKGHMNIAYGFLSEEEKEFVKDIFPHFKNSIGLFEKVLNRLGDYALIETKVAPGTPIEDTLFYCTSYLYLLPLSLQYYNSIIEALEKGRKLAAASLFRALIEVFIDFHYLSLHKNLIVRYLEYYKVSKKWLFDSTRQVINYGGNEKAAIEQDFNDFLSKFKIAPNEKLTYWAGISPKKMATEAFTKLKEFYVNLGVDDDNNASELNMVYAYYCKYSAFMHPASTSRGVVENGTKFLVSLQECGEGDKKYVSEDFLDKYLSGDFLDPIIFETVFFGWDIIFNILGSLVTMVKDQNIINDIEKAMGEIMGYSEFLERIQLERKDWETIKNKFYKGQQKDI